VQTIGVAIAIPEPWGSQLQDYRAALGDVSATLIPTHITLIPPTAVEGEDAMAEVEEHLLQVASRHRAFGIHLRGTGTFRPVSPVVFVTVARGISQCEALARDVRTPPLDVRLTFPYHPHVTVAHEVADDLLDRAFAELADFECHFEAEEFLLYHHSEGEGWMPNRAFALRPGR